MKCMFCHTNFISNTRTCSGITTTISSIQESLLRTPHQIKLPVNAQINVAENSLKK